MNRLTIFVLLVLNIRFIKTIDKIKFSALVILLLFISSCSVSKKLNNSNTKNNYESNENKHKKEFYKTYSEKFKINLAGNEKQELILFIDKWIGVPYKSAGNTFNGVDCSGLAANLYDEVYNIKISRTVKAIYNETIPVKKENLKDGDFVFFKIGKANDVNHIGIYISNNKFVHSSTKKGVIISDLDEDYYKKYFFSGGRVKNK